ncbi:MAG: hypothetical protein JNJ46_21390 [Myxococcales bacterium]|nr:hypothetical protein [Myxococcales bacterium]
MRKKLPPRVVGIYRDRSRFRVVICEDGKRRSLIVDSQEEAQRRAEEIAAQLRTPRPSLTVADAVHAWHQARLNSGACKPLTLREQEARLRAFLSSVLSCPLEHISAEHAQRIYLDAVQRPCPKSGKPPAAASLRLYLKLSRAMFAWAGQHEYCRSNPFSGIKPIDEARSCKPQLGIDEARRFLDQALAHSVTAREPLALAAATALLLGLRTREVLSRSVGDLSESGQLLRVERGRCAKETQHVDVPTVLQPHLLALTAGHAADEPLFGRSRQGRQHSRQSLHTLVRRLCQRAHVPAVCIDSLRGLFTVLGPRSGAVSHAVAARLGLGSWPPPPEATLPTLLAQASAPPACSIDAEVGVNAPHHAPIQGSLATALASCSAEQIVAAVDAGTLHRLRALLNSSAAPDSPGAEPLPTGARVRASGS